MTFIKEMFCEPNGQASSNRVCIVAIIAIMLVCIVRMVLLDGKFPEIPKSLADVVEWVLMFLVGGNVLKNGIFSWQSVKGGTDGNAGTDQGS